MKFLFATAVIIAAQTCGFAQLILDSFPADGPLVGTTPQVGQIWQAGSGSGTLSVQNGAVLIHPSISQDAICRFSDRSNETIYAGFTITFTTIPTTTSSSAWPFAFESIGGGMIARLFLTTGTDASNPRIGIENNLDNPIKWPEKLETGKPYRVIVGLTESGSSDYASLWINPAHLGSPKVSDAVESFTSGISGVIINPHNFSTWGATIDELIVTTSFYDALVDLPDPEPQVYQPDAIIGFNSVPKKGDNIIDPSGKLQRRITPLYTNESRSVFFDVENEGNSADSFKIQGSKGDYRFKIRYFRNGTDVTSQVVQGTYNTGSVPPDERFSMSAIVTAKTQEIGAKKDFLIRAVSQLDPEKDDAVSIRAKSEGDFIWPWL